MTVEIRVPPLGESITEATVGRWLKANGEAVKTDEPLVELETDKVAIEVPAPASGFINAIVVNEGDVVEVNGLLGTISPGDGAAAGGDEGKIQTTNENVSTPKSTPDTTSAPVKESPTQAEAMPPSPSASKMLDEASVDADNVAGSGKRGQVLKGDVIDYLSQKPTTGDLAGGDRKSDISGNEKVVPMTRLRLTVANRLKEAQNTAAMLTTFNDVDMSAVMALRKHYRDEFEKRHGVRLGFMGFFIKACIAALKEVPAVNAEINGTDIIYKNYYHIGVAVGSKKGLVVPVIRNADRLSLAEIELTIRDLATKANEGKLKLDDLQGGTFTISNGGVYGSLLSTPILNAPQTGILGMHRIEDRPVARNGQIVIKPMMYLAVSYDHRMVDGKEAVTFLVAIKNAIEDPQRLLLDV